MLANQQKKSSTQHRRQSTISMGAEYRHRAVDVTYEYWYAKNMQRILFDTSLEDIFRLPPKRKTGLRHLKLCTVRDLLYHFPHRYEKPAMVQTIAETHEGDVVSIEGKILSIEAKKTWKTKKPIAEAVIEEVRPTFNVAPTLNVGRNAIRAIWFHQPYIAKQLPPETLVRLTGKVTKYKNKLTMVNPVHERIAQISNFNNQNLNPNPYTLNPVYSETYGVSSRWVHAAIENVFSRLSADIFVDPLPEDIRTRYHLPSLRRALEAIHFSQNEKEAEGARKRFAFEEIFFIQLTRVAMRNERNQQRAAAIRIDANVTQAFRESLPFALTRAQEKVIGEICAGISGEPPRPLDAAATFFNGADEAALKIPDKAKQLACVPSARLLQGDVGSGKTLAAAVAALQVAKNDYQTAYMAPTEILARQHFAEFCKRLGPFGARIGLLTSSEALLFPSKAFKDKPAHLSKQQLFKKAREGLVDIVIGTHALIANSNKGIIFKNLAFVIVDEQHRFGVHQRAKLLNPSKPPLKLRGGLPAGEAGEVGLLPHYLSMTATPIPRTLALTVYGDLDLSLLDEMPPGRAEVKTEVRTASERDQAYGIIAREIAAGRQAFVICPRIEKDPLRPQSEASDESGMKAVEEEQKHLAHTIFPHHTIGLLHGKLTPKEKEKTMRTFRAGGFPILVATTVVEVGIDIPNATVILIEGAERFGLAQLHQLRGRVARSTHAATCIAIPGTSSKFAKARLQAFATLTDGFALAEQDLQLRGPGELSGINQWGISDIGMEALRNIKMVEAARNEAQRILACDPRLDHYPRLKKALSIDRASMHLE